MARVKDKCPLESAVAVGATFDTSGACEYMSNYCFGIYNYVMGVFLRLSIKNAIVQIDNLNMKKNPEKVIGKDIDSIYTLPDFMKIIAKVEGYKSIAHYAHESSINHRLQDIKKPIFFLSSVDDPLFGPHVIPVDHCHENILIGTTKTGGHLCFFEGTFLPTF